MYYVQLYIHYTLSTQYKYYSSHLSTLWSLISCIYLCTFSPPNLWCIILHYSMACLLSDRTTHLRSDLSSNPSLWPKALDQVMPLNTWITTVCKLQFLYLFCFYSAIYNVLLMKNIMYNIVWFRGIMVIKRMLRKKMWVENLLLLLSSSRSTLFY